MVIRVKLSFSIFYISKSINSTYVSLPTIFRAIAHTITHDTGKPRENIERMTGNVLQCVSANFVMTIIVSYYERTVTLLYECLKLTLS